MSSLFIFKQNLISHSSRPRVHLSKGSGCFSSIFFFFAQFFLFCFCFSKGQALVSCFSTFSKLSCGINSTSPLKQSHKSMM